jgi:hypothetical protein
MIDETTVLRVTYESLQHEFKRVQHLLHSENKELLGKNARDIGSKFGTAEGKVQQLLDTIDNLLKEASKDAIETKLRRDCLRDAWKQCIELKTELIPTISSELLAVIGGLYIQGKLDNIREDEGDRFLSFSHLAESLVRDLARRSAKDWGSVLIVGEERIGFTEAEIIRLRFPACDIWHLPFTAHEYGYLVAQMRPPHQISNLRIQMEREIVPPLPRERPTERDYYLKEVHDLWDSEYPTDTPLREFATQDDRFVASRPEPVAIAQRQFAFLSRLFADAFATFFVGPAYVYALLYLRFVRDDTPYHPSPTMPPFSHRFVFALETLKWMDSLPVPATFDFRPRRSPFDYEIDESSGIPRLWRQTMMSIGQAESDQAATEHYDAIKRRYSHWLNQVKEALRYGFSISLALEETWSNWHRVVTELEKLMSEGTDMRFKRPRPEIWAVLNAAWSARWRALEEGESSKPILFNALRLLDKNDETILEEERPSSLEPLASRLGSQSVRLGGDSGDEGQRKEQLEAKKERAVTVVKTILFRSGNPQAYDQFNEMVQAVRFVRENAIVLALADDGSASEQYRWLHMEYMRERL